MYNKDMLRGRLWWLAEYNALLANKWKPETKNRPDVIKFEFTLCDNALSIRKSYEVKKAT